jgi:hypothetical protein
MSCGGSHLGFPIGIKSRNFVEDLPMIIPGQFGFNCPVFQRRSILKHFPIGSNVKLSPAVAAILKMIIGRSSTKFLFFMPIGNPRWLPPQDID